MSRFDYVKYDEVATNKQAAFKGPFEVIAHAIQRIGEGLPEEVIQVGRARSLALTKLEECYMWLGKAIRDEQIARNVQLGLQEERKDG